MDIAAIRADIADAMDGLDIRPYAVMPEAPAPPCAIVVPNDWQYDATFEGGADLEFSIELFAPAASTEGGQYLLDAWISTNVGNSLVDALNNIDNLAVKRMQNYRGRVFEDGTRVMSAELVVEVLAE